MKDSGKRNEVTSGRKRAGKISSIFSPRGSDTASKSPAVYIKTFGWPLVTVARDGIGCVKEGKWLGMKGLRRIKLKIRDGCNVS